MPDILIVLVIILVIAVLLRGPKTLPKLGEALGRGVKEAKAGAVATQEEIQSRTTTPTTPTTPTKPDDADPPAAP